ncbi:MAG: GAF domain-containing protein [Ardenticatenales bacterium]|nr:GAF domain-containing protein [Ardenticatenales bacterium]
MQPASLPPNEVERLASLRDLGILHTPAEERFDRITRTAARLFQVPIALISLVDADHQWLKSRQGFFEQAVDRTVSFCAHALLQDALFVISDSHLDPRFADNPLVTGVPHLRFYAGCPLKSRDGYPLGTLCIIDDKPRPFSEANQESLRDLAAWAEGELNGRGLLHAALEGIARATKETEYAQSETRAILDAVSEAIIMITPDDRTHIVNQRFSDLFGIHPEEVLANSLSEIRPFLERVLERPDILNTLMTSTLMDDSTQFSDLIAQRYPEQRQLALFSAPVKSMRDIHLGRLFVFRDVTHERAVDRMKSEFVAIVSHELRTPLTSIKGFVDLLVSGETGELQEEQLEFLGIVKTNADRLMDLIDDLLNLSRIETGKVELERVPVDILPLIRATVETLRRQFEGKQQQVVIEAPPALPQVLADSDRLIQILTNLLSNAHKYTPAGGKITITAQAMQEQMAVSVQDTGIGLSPEDQGKLFTRFFRARNRSTQEVGGTGLGLAITRSLVQLHEGDIVVRSAPNEGSTFTFTLPFAEKLNLG